ncbi:unnamed protein product [Cylindrotheca closterium]|uniref:Protein kinase domain-containing protein n=1 Tax=Cylindrotheca closterium TaxID=2856 RepID=A0AAD2FMR5_9STRA|nr:unnamed protein product [Cylindrotheca closterium]
MSSSTTSSIEQEIELGGNAMIERVKRDIEVVNEYLKSPKNSDDDNAFYQHQKSQLRQEESQLRRLKLLLMQRTPPPPPTPSIPVKQQVANTLFLEEMRKEIAAIFQEALTKTNRATPQKSPSSFGAGELRRLERLGHVHSPDEEGKGEAVLTNEQARSLLQLETEHQMVAFLTPFLAALFQCNGASSNRVLVNSEAYKWLKTSNDENSAAYNQNPDMFICHKSIYKKRDPFDAREDDKLLQMRRSTDVFGQLSNWDLRRFLYLVLDAKKDIDDSAFGQTINYGAHLSLGENSPITVRLVLFDRESFWLVQTVKGTASSVRKCRWVDGGSKSRLEKFMLQDPVIEILDKACFELGLVPEVDGYLGGGAFGLVFKVCDQNGAALALKIVLDVHDKVAELQRQMAITNEAQRKCPHLIVGVEENSFRKFDKLGAVLLFSEVGNHYSSLSKKAIFDSLQELHDNNIAHGSARVDNVVCVNGEAKWIDLQRAYIWNTGGSVSELGKRDYRDLMESIKRSQYFD